MTPIRITPVPTGDTPGSVNIEAARSTQERCIEAAVHPADLRLHPHSPGTTGDTRIPRLGPGRRSSPDLRVGAGMMPANDYPNRRSHSGADPTGTNIAGRHWRVPDSTSPRVPAYPGPTFDTVRTSAHGCWAEILAHLGIEPSALRDRHGPCPGCGGKDRFRFDDQDIGRFYCNGGGEPVSGDGFALLQHVYGWTARESLERVAQSIGIVASSPTRIPPPKPAKEPPRLSRTQIYARELWLRANKAGAIVADHPYAIRKGIGWAAGAGRAMASGSVIGKNSDCLVVPIRTMAGKLLAVQCINAAGDKQTFGGMGEDGCLLLGNTLDNSIPWIVCEGWADGVSFVFHVNRGNAVAAVAFGIKRMPRVAEALAERFRPAEIVIVEDAA
jgi:phage/plasmid primase-like uncharacterized protein